MKLVLEGTLTLCCVNKSYLILLCRGKLISLLILNTFIVLLNEFVYYFFLCNFIFRLLYLAFRTCSKRVTGNVQCL